MLKIRVNFDVYRARRELQGDQRAVQKAALRALDRVSKTARKAADQTIRERITLKSGVVKDAIRVVYPFGRLRLIADLISAGKAIPLREYQARETRKGVTFAVVRGQRKLYMAKGRPAFKVNKYGQHVFVRVEAEPPGPKKARIRKVFGPAIPQRFWTKRVKAIIEKVAAERWPIEFEREVKYRASKL